MRSGRTVALSVMLGLLAVPTALRAAAAAQAGSAMVIGDSAYQGRPHDSSCVEAAGRVGERLRGQGWLVTTLLDPTGIELRAGLDTFAANLSDRNGATLVYVCSDAIAVGGRIFVLPTDIDVDRPVDPETQGVVLQAMLNAIGGSTGALYADFSPVPGARIQRSDQRLPAGLHLALSISASDGKPAALGRGLADPSVPIADWSSTVAALSSRPGLSNRASTVFLPAPEPSAVPSEHVTEPVASIRNRIVPAAPPPMPPLMPAEPAASGANNSTDGHASAQNPTTTQAARPTSPTQARKKASSTWPVHARQHGESRPSVAAPPNPRLARIQAALARRGLYAGPANGEMDAATTAAIRHFQASLGEPPSGVLGQIEIVRLLNP